MSRHDINLNINYNKNRSKANNNIRRATATNVNDTAAVKKYTSEIKKAIEKLTDKSTANTEKLLNKLLRDLTRNKTGAGDFGITDAEIKRVVRGVAQEVTRSIVKSAISSPSTSSDKSTVVSARQMEKAANDIAKKIDKLTGLKLDTKDLQVGLDKLSKNIIPPSTVTAIKDITTTSNTLKTISRDITTLVNSIKSMRTSGGGIDVSEIGPVITSLKKLAVDVKSIHREAEKAKETFNSLSKEIPEAANNFKKAMTSLKTEATKSLTGVAGRAKEDPKNFAKEFSGNIIALLKKSEALKGTGLEKAIKKMEETGSNIGDFTSELKKFRQDLKKTKSEGKISVEGFDKLVRDINSVTSKLEKIPKDFGFDKLPKQVEELFRQIEKFSKYTTQVTAKVVVDDNSFKTEIKKIESKKVVIPANIDVDTKKAYNDTLALVSKLKIEADKKALMLKVQPVIEKIEKAISVNDKAALTKELQVVANLRLDTSDMANDIRKTINLIEGQQPVVEVKIDSRKAVQEAKRTNDIIRKTLATKPNVRALSSFGDPRNMALYKAKVVTPSETGEVNRVQTINILSKEAKEIKRATEDNIKRLSSSLYNLQKQIVTTLDKQFDEAGKKWAVVKSPKAESPTQAFKLSPGGRQWTVQIANIDRLQREMKDFQSSIDVLVKNYKTRSIETRTSAVGSERMPELIGQWLKSVSVKEIKGLEGLDDVIKGKLIDIKESSKGTDVGEPMRAAIKQAFGEADRLTRIFKQTYAETEAKRELQREGLVKTLALPAAKTATTGESFFQTVHGAQRALPKYAKFETGFEVLYKKLNELKKFDVARGFIEDIRSVGIRPSPEEKPKAEKLSQDMIKAVADSSFKSGMERKEYIQKLFQGAARGKGSELERSGLAKAGQFEKQVEQAITMFNKLDAGNQTFDEFLKVMKDMNLTAYDVVKSLNTISSENVYDIISQVLKGDEKISPLGTVAKQPTYERSVRNFEKAIGEIEGMLPLLERNRPRRGYHQENVVNLMTRTGELYSEKYSEERLGPEQQKKLIKDLNLELNETLKRIEASGKSVAGLKRLTSLGIPESQAGNIEEYRYGKGTGLQFLPSLKATNVKLYAEDLTSLAPFQQFQQAGRNISNVTNAMADFGKTIETPKLRSEKERALLESGRYGQKGYGYNVTAELRNTAATFEDQILISGKLAKAATSAVKTLVKPGPAGRVRGATVEERIAGTGVTEIKPGEVSGVAKEFMKILGMPEEYKGRADKALIDAVEKTVSVVRGESVEVQQARLAETFLNYFGRKLTTRYGSKGVSITPTNQSENLADILTQFTGKKIKVDQEASLGYQVAPKSLGMLASELFGSDVKNDLKKRLVASGNKFLIDIFQDTDIVAGDEAIKTKKLYNDFAKAWQDLFGEDIPKVGPEGIKSLRETYTKKFGEKAAFDIKPIDVRISSYGAAKRGLQTEFLESIFSNIAGAGQGGVTTLKQLKQPNYERLLKSGGLSQYSKALGYTGAGKTAKELEPELFKLFGGKGSFEEALSSGDEKAVIAKRAAALEAASSFYSTIIDEFGKVRKGFVGEKFLQIIEEPHLNPEWQRGQVERGLKGAKLNLPAFSAYATIFGEQSNFMKEIQDSLDINAGKHWEYLKALQAVQDKDSQIYQNLTKGLKTVDIGKLRSFELSTGVYGKKYTTDELGNQITNPRSFADTILDIEKYPEAFKLAIPTGQREPSGEIKKEDFYVPGALARGTYEDPLLAGERGLDVVSRRLTHIVNMAKELEEVLSSPDKALDPSSLINKVPPMVATWVDDAWKMARRNTPEDISALEDLVKKLSGGLSTTRAPSPMLINTGGRTEIEYARGFYSTQMGKAQAGEKTKGEALATTISTISDLLVGKKTGTPEQMAAPTGLTRAIDAGAAAAFTQAIGIDLVQGEIDKRVEALQKAKIDYYHTLASTATGKSGVVEGLFFNRKIPAVMGRAVTAVVDKRKDIEVFQKRLISMENRYGENFSEQAEALNTVAKSHAEAITGYQKIGVPVLRQEELGVTEAFASKIPLEFMKKFKVTGDKGVMAQKPEAVKGTLKDLLKYVDVLQRASKEEGPVRQQEVMDYIENDLVPYIESIRYPFTGTSSVAPFKPKLIEEGSFRDTSGRALEKNALIVPGIPEGMKDLASIIEQLQSKIEIFTKRREELQTAAGPQEEIDKMTYLIRELNAAISDVIPKYTAQAQKLDFDGDQIEIHAAMTAAARKDIATHYKRFHERGADGGIRTQDVFMKRFLSEAAEVPTTGPYVLGESLKAFEKKFPSGKGFEFLKSPFLTPELEYLNSREALGVLQGNRAEGDVSNVIKNALMDVNRPVEEINKIMSEISSFSKEDPTKYINNIMELFETSYAEILKQVESGIKKQLYESKFGETVEAQLFKIHTGPETEAIYRIHRLAESAAGFGGGMIGGQRRSSDYFKKRFPDIKATGGNPEEEFHTMINEVLRFGIQKGMDVKHAGDKPVIGEMLSHLTRGSEGASELWTKIQDKEDKTFGDLRDFAEDNEKAIRMRLGELPTSQILAEAKQISTSRGQDVSGLDMKTREELIKLMVDKVGFKGFLEELSILIRKEAVEGLVKQAETWTPAKRRKPGGFLDPVKGDIQQWAENQITKQIEQFGGINIRNTITASQIPLYTTRTSTATTAEEYRKFSEKFGNIAIPQEQVSGISEKSLKSYQQKYKESVATAMNIQRELRSFAGSNQPGAYGEMIKGTIDALYKQQAEVEDYISSLMQEKYDPSAAKATDLSERVLSRQGVSNFANTVLNMRTGLRDEVERLSDLAGVPGLSDTELFEVQKQTSKKFADVKRLELKDSGISKDEIETQVAEYVDRMVEKAQALRQLDRVIDALSAKRYEGRLLQDIAPRAAVGGQSYAESRRNAMQEARSKLASERGRREHEYAKTLASTEGFGAGPSGPGTTITGGGIGIPSGGVVPVRIVGIDTGVVFNISGAAGLRDLTRIVPERNIEGTQMYSKEQELEDLMYYEKSMKSSKARVKAMKDNEYLQQATAGMEGKATEIAAKKFPRPEKDISSDIYKYMLPRDIVTGGDTQSIYENLRNLHEDTVLYQKLYKGIDLEDLNKYPKAIGEAIGKVSEEGPDYDTFAKLTKELKELSPEKFSGKDLVDSWKAYRLAIGDWMLKRAEEARKQSEELDKTGDIRAANRAYGTFRKYIDKYQEFVKRSIGKRTDVYTEDKRFIYPALAKAAGVYMSPEQIHKKIGGDLGNEDEKLINVYKEIVKGLESSTEISPSKTNRKIFAQLSEVRTDLAKVLADAEKFGRLGPEVIEAWNFDKLSDRITRLRAAMQQILKESGELDSIQRKNVENIVKYLKSMESLYSHITPGDTSMGDTGIIPVTRSQSPRMQTALHARNIQAAREYMRRPEEAGGLPVGRGFSYTEKIVDQVGQVVKNVRHDFKKYGEEVTSAGERVGLFSEKNVDLIEKMQRVNATFGNAIRRVVMWGAASRLIYGGTAYLSKSLGELSEIETGMAQLRMVMNPLETDFNKISKSATGFAKQYGVPVTGVLKSMKIFAQQGLKQEEVLDRTQTATLASNVTTLNAKEATEALTAAMKVFREEGDQSLRFLDAWSEVEAKHAITAEDMANAIKKSAAAAKTAGFTFDQLNGIVAAIGATTRQSGKEVGTSLRFIARRLFSEEGPKVLAKLPTPITTLTGSGELRAGFDILSDLAAQWKDLTSAQKLNVAQSIGGTRQYNALLVLMDQWDEALRGIRNSTNSKGSAERRNLEVMKTYAKQLEQARAAATELKMELGKIVLPTFKIGLHALKLVTEAITNIPAPIKIATTGLLLMFGAMAKGVPIIDSVMETFSKGKSVLGQFSTDLSKQFKMAKFEITGKGVGDELYGLKTFSRSAGPDMRVKDIKDLHSSIGKVTYAFKSAGDAYNKFLAGGSEKIANVGKGISNTADKVDKFTDKFQLILGGLSILTPGIEDEAIVAGSQVAESFAKGMAHGVGKIADILGKPFGTAAKFLRDKDPALLKSIAPLAVTIGAAIPSLKLAYDKFQKLTKSAQDFEKAMDAVRKTNENQLKSIRDVIQSYDTLADRVEDIRKASDPETRQRRMTLGTYEAPLVGMQKIQKDVTDLSNQLAESNLGLVAGYDKLGNAVLKSTGNFKSYMKQLEGLRTLRGVETEIEILEKFITDLTETEGPEKFKVAMKELAESFPVIGDLVARNINVAPAKALEMAAEDLNKRINIKQKYPLSTAADEDIKRLQGVLSKARDVFQDSYSDFERIYGNILSPAMLKGLSPEKIQKVLSSPALQKAYELKLNIDPKFKLASGVKAEDVMGKEILTALNPQIAGIVDVTSEFTKANLETAGVEARKAAKVYSGDIVTLRNKIEGTLTKPTGRAKYGPLGFLPSELGFRKLEEEFAVSGNQAIVKLKETSDGVFEWVAQYFNTKTLTVEERPFSDIEPFVESIFPLQKIKEDFSYRMDALNTFVSGASAGLVGITAKDFKKDFSLGERFFSEIPTTTLLQGGFGYKPETGYGQVPQAKNFGKDIQEFYFKPMDELKTRLEQLDKLKLEGIESGDITLSKDMYDEINKLLTILKNNQVVLQFRAVFVDLMKEFSESERILKQNLAIMANRNKIEKETGGLLKGISKGLGDYDTGITKFSELTPRQSLLLSSGPARNRAQELKALSVTADNQLSQLDSIQKALVNMDDIRSVARATGAALDKSNLGNFVEQVAKQADEEGPFKELSKINTKVADNTSDTVDRLDKLLENQGDPETLERMLSSFTDKLGAGLLNRQPVKIANALERVAELRKTAEKTGNQEAVTAANKVIDQLTKKLISEVGLQKGAEIIDKNFQLFRKDFTSKEFQQRAFSGIDPELFLQKIGKQQYERRGLLGTGNPTFASIESTKEFKKIRILQEKENKKSIIDSRTLAKVQAAIAAASYVEKLNNNKVVKSLDGQVSKLDDQINQAKEAGKSDAYVAKLTEKQVAITAQRNKVQKDADFYGTVAALNASGIAASELARAFGLTDKQIKALNVSAAGTYMAMKLASGIIGKEMPDSAKKFGEELSKTAKKVAAGEKPSFKDVRTIGKAGKEMTSELAKNTKELYGKSTETIDAEIKRKLESEIKTGTKVTSPEDLNKIAEQAKARAQSEVGGATLKQMVAAYVATGLVDYVSKRTGEKSELATLESQMAGQQDAIVATLEKYPDAASRVLQDIYKEQEKAQIEGKPADLKTVTKSLVQDTEGEYKKVVEMISDYNEEIIDSYEETAEKIAEIQAKAADDEIREADRRAAYSAIAAEKERQTLEAISKRFSLSNIIQKGLEGYGGEIALPVPKQELSTQQRIYAESGSSFKKLIDSYSQGTGQLETMRTRIEDITKRMAEESDIFRTSDNQEVVKLAKARYEELSEELKKQVDITDEYAKKLQNFANSYMYLDRFAKSMHQLEDALREVSNQRSIENLPGYLNFRDSIDKLLGGAHPEAVQTISAEEERMASRVGIDLRNMQSTRYDVEEARLRSQLRDATGQQAIDLRRQLADLPEQRQRDIYARDQQRFDETLKRSITPYEEQLGALERVRTLPGLSGDVQDQIFEYQKQISTALEHAADKMSVDEYSKELEANRKLIGPEAYESEKKRLDQIKDAGIQSIYRGVPPWEQMGALPDEIISALKEQTKISAEGLGLQANISDPIVNKLDETNTILKKIAEEEFGMAFEEDKGFSGRIADNLSEMTKKGLDRVVSAAKIAATNVATPYILPFKGLKPAKDFLFGKELEDYKDLSKYMKRAAGGYISGPGNSTSDSIPAYLSDGEYVIKAASAQRIGMSKLNYMNKFGKVPGFAEGGQVKDKSLLEKFKDWFWGGPTTGKEFENKTGSYFESGKAKEKRYDEILGENNFAGGGKVFRAIEEKFGKGVDWLKDKRLALAQENADSLDKKGVFGKIEAGANTVTNLANMAGLATTEIAGRIIKSPLDALAGIEGASDYIANKGLKNVGKDIINNKAFQGLIIAMGKSNIPANIGMEGTTPQEEALYGVMGDITKGVYKSAKEDIKTGGTGITAGVLEFLMGTGLAKEVKNVNILGKLKSTTNKLLSSEVGAVGGDISGELAKEAIRKKLKLFSKEEGKNFISNLASPYTKDLAGNIIDAKGLNNFQAQKLLASTDFDKVSKYIPKNSKYIGSGAESLVLDAGNDVVVKITTTLDEVPDIPGVLQPLKRINAGEYNVDFYPKVSTNLGKRSSYETVKQLKEQVEKYGYEFIDPHMGNIGLTSKGKPTIIDAGAVAKKGEREAKLRQQFKTLFKQNQEKTVKPKFDAKSAGNRLEELLGEGFAEGGQIEDKSLIEKLKDWFWGGSITGKEFEGKAGSYVEPAKDRDKRILDEMDKYGKADGGQIEDIEDEKWSLRTLKEVNDKFLMDRRDSDLPEDLKGQMSEKFMGIGAQYNTPILKEALEKKKYFINKRNEQKEALKKAKSEKYKEQAIAAGLANIAGIEPDYKVMDFDKSRQLINLDKGPISYQSKSDLKLLGVDTSYAPAKNLAKGYTGTKLTSDAIYATSRAKEKRDKANLIESLTDRKFTQNELSKTPSYISKIKRTYDLAQEVLGNFDDITGESINTFTMRKNAKDKATLSQMMERNKDLLQRFQAGEDPMSKEFMRDFNLATMGGETSSKGVSAKILFNKANPQYGGLLNYYLYKMRNPNVDISGDTRTGFTGATLTEEQKKTKEELNKLHSYGNRNEPSRVTQGFTGQIKELFSGAKTGILGQRRQTSTAGFVNKIDDFFASLFNRSPEVKHNGGIVHKTGLVFAKGGEVIGYPSGAESINKIADKALNIPAVKIDTSELLDKLESIELKVEDKTLSVEDKILSVDVSNKVEVEQPAWKIAVDEANIPSISIEQPDWKVEVDVPKDSISVDVNIGDAATRLNDAITSALNNTVKVEVTGTTGNAVGGEKFDQLASTVSNISDRLITVKSDLENKIRLLGTTNNQTTDIDRRVASIVDTKVANLQRDINDIRTSVGSIESTQRQKDVYYDYKISDLDYRLKNSMNITGIGTGGLIR